jgi:hypothetical protein
MKLVIHHKGAMATIDADRFASLWRGPKGDTVQGDPGKNGNDGRGIVDAHIVGERLFIKFSDDTLVDVGRAAGPKGDPGETKIVREYEQRIVTLAGSAGPKGDPGDPFTFPSGNELETWTWKDGKPQWIANQPFAAGGGHRTTFNTINTRLTSLEGASAGGGISQAYADAHYDAINAAAPKANSADVSSANATFALSSALLATSLYVSSFYQQKADMVSSLALYAQSAHVSSSNATFCQSAGVFVTSQYVNSFYAQKNYAGFASSADIYTNSQYVNSFYAQKNYAGFASSADIYPTSATVNSFYQQKADMVSSLALYAQSAHVSSSNATFALSAHVSSAHATFALSSNVASFATTMWTSVMLTGPVGINSTTATSITAFNFTPLANAKYEFSAKLMLRATVASNAPRAGIAWPTGMTDGVATIRECVTTATERFLYGNIAANMLSAVGSFPNSTASFLTQIEGVVFAGASPGSVLQIMLAGTAANSVVAQAGSMFRWRRLS